MYGSDADYNRIGHLATIPTAVMRGVGQMAHTESNPDRKWCWYNVQPGPGRRPQVASPCGRAPAS